MSLFDNFEDSNVSTITNESYEKEVESTVSTSEWQARANHFTSNRKRHPTGILKKPKCEHANLTVIDSQQCNLDNFERLDNDSLTDRSSFLHSPFTESQQKEDGAATKEAAEFGQNTTVDHSYEGQQIVVKEEKVSDVPNSVPGEDIDSGNTWVVSARVRHRSNIDSYDSSQLDTSTDCHNFEPCVGSIINTTSDPVLLSSTDVIETNEECEKPSHSSNPKGPESQHVSKNEESSTSDLTQNKYEASLASCNSSYMSNHQIVKGNVELKTDGAITKTALTKYPNDAKGDAIVNGRGHLLSQRDRKIENFKQWYPNSYFAPLGKQYLHQSQENISKTDNKLAHLASRPNQGSMKHTRCYSPLLQSENNKKPPRPQLPRAQSFTSLEGDRSHQFIDLNNNTFDGSFRQLNNSRQFELGSDYRPAPNAPKRRVRHKSMADLNQYKHQMEYVRDDCVYDYDNSMPYRSSTVARYLHRNQADPFLPPQGIPQYTPRIECKKAVPPERRKSISDKIFDEYQEKLAERIERKSNSTLRLNKPKQELEKEPEDYGVLLQLQKEFMGRVQEKNLCPGTTSEDRLEDRITLSNYRIEGNAEKLNDAIADDVQHLLKVDDSIKLKPRLKDSLYRNHLRNSVQKAAIRDRKLTENNMVDRSSRDFTNRFDAYQYNEMDVNGRPYYVPPSTYGDSEYDYQSSSCFDFFEANESIPRYKTMSPTLTMLINRENKIFPKASKYHPVSNTIPFAAPNEKIYNIKREYEKELDGKIRKFFDLSRIPVKGVGPTTSCGMPTSLKTTVDERHRPDWYRKMFGSIHQGTKRSEDLVDGVLERWKILGQESSTDSESDVQLYSNMRNPRFKNQPRRIENYRPGRCSLSAKEAETENVRTPYTLIQQKLFEKNARLNKAISSDERTERQRSTTPSNHSRQRLSRSKSPSAAYHQKNNFIKTTAINNSDHFVQSKHEKNRNLSPNIETQYKSSICNDPQRARTGSPTSSNKTLPDNDYAIDVNDGPTNDKTVTFVETKMRVIHSFQPIKRGELNLRRGEMVTVHGKVGDHWYYGEIDGRCGLFPTNYVGTSCSGPISQTPTLTGALASHDFQGRSKVELSFKKGDMLTISRKIDDNWYEGRLDDKVGIIPAMYLELEK